MRPWPWRDLVVALDSQDFDVVLLVQPNQAGKWGRPSGKKAGKTASGVSSKKVMIAANWTINTTNSRELMWTKLGSEDFNCVAP